MLFVGVRLFECSLAALAALFAVGCRSSTSTSQPAALPPFGISSSASDWPAARQLLDGFEIGKSGDRWRVGDRVLLGIRATRGDRASTRYLLVELLGGIDTKTTFALSGKDAQGKPVRVPVSPPSRTTRLTVFDERGERLTQSDGSIPDRLFDNGLHGLLAVTTTTATRPADANAYGPFYAIASLAQFGKASGGNSALSSMTREVVGLPSLWSLLTRPPTLSLNMTSVTADQTRLGAETFPAARIDLDVSFSDELIMQVEVSAIRNVPPLGLVSGIVRAEGRHPTDPSRRLNVEVLAARRGEGKWIRLLTIVPTTAPAE